MTECLSFSRHTPLPRERTGRGWESPGAGGSPSRFAPHHSAAKVDVYEDQIDRDVYVPRALQGVFPAEKMDSEISGVLEQALLLRADDRVVLDDEDAFA